MFIILILSLIVGAGACRPGCRALTNATIAATDFDAVFAGAIVDADVLAANRDALNDAIALLNVTFPTREQLGTFLGTVRFNTDGLARHYARCVETDSCSADYDTACRHRGAANDTRRFYPRSAMMVAYQCNYAYVDGLLGALSCIDSVESDPDLLADPTYSMLAALAVWHDSPCHGATLDGFGACLHVMNPWECSEAGAADRAGHIATINDALEALGVASRMPSNLTCEPLAATSFPTPTPSTTTSAPTPSPSSLNVSDVACGVIPRDAFASLFDDVNRSVANADFDALSMACADLDLRLLDMNQASFFLGAVRTRNVGRRDKEPRVAEFESALKQMQNAECLRSTSAGRFGECIWRWFGDLCATDAERHAALLNATERASSLLGGVVDTGSSACPDVDEESAAAAAPLAVAIAVAIVAVVL